MLTLWIVFFKLLCTKVNVCLDHIKVYFLYILEYVGGKKNIGPTTVVSRAASARGKCTVRGESKGISEGVLC